MPRRPDAHPACRDARCAERAEAALRPASLSAAFDAHAAVMGGTVTAATG